MNRRNVKLDTFQPQIQEVDRFWPYTGIFKTKNSVIGCPEGTIPKYFLSIDAFWNDLSALNGNCFNTLPCNYQFGTIRWATIVLVSPGFGGVLYFKNLKTNQWTYHTGYIKIGWLWMPWKGGDKKGLLVQLWSFIRWLTVNYHKPPGQLARLRCLNGPDSN